MSNFSTPLPFFVKKVKSPRRKIRIRRPARKALRSLFTLLLAAIALTGLFFILRNQKPAEAAWFNDNWMYRSSVSVTKTVATQTNVYISVNVNTSGAGQWKANCGDMRWTDSTGKLLQYYISGVCGNNPAAIHVFFPNLPLGSNLIYYYYGNPTAANGFNAADFTTVATNYSVDAIGSQENSPGPVAYWKFDEGQGQTTNDSTQNAKSGTLGATSAATTDDPTWATEDMCVSGKCLKFDGSNDFVNVAGSIAGVKSVSFWVKPISVASASLLVLNAAGGTANLTTDANGAITAGAGFTSPTIYINGVVSSTLVANKWQFVEVTTGTGITASNVMLGRVNAGYLNGFMDEIKLYQYARSAAQIKTDYNSRNSTKGSSENLGNSKDNNLGALANGLLGYWKMDETSGNATDSSGNATTLTNTGTATFTAGQFGNSTSLNGSSQYFYAADNATLSITGNLTLSAWIYPASVAAGTRDIIGKWDGANKSYLLQQNAAGLVFYVGSSSNYVSTTALTLAINTWYHVTAVYNAQAQTAAIYVNGAPQTTSTTGTIPASIADDTGRLHVGAQDSTAGLVTNYFNGRVDDARIYNRALSPAEVAQLYNWAPGPVGYWKMDENTGTSANDSSGNTNTGILTLGPVWNKGKIGSAVKFDGSDDVANAASGSTLDNLTNITIEAWIYPTGWGGGSSGRIVHKSNTDAGDTDCKAFFVNSSTNRLYLTHGFSTTRGYWGTPDNSLQLSQWQHVAVTYNKSATTNDPAFYINGIPQAITDKQAPVGTAYDDSAENLLIGNSKAGDRGFAGSIDEVRVYNYIRTQKQIVEDMLGSPKPVSGGGGNAGQGALGYWKFDEGYGDTANNSGNGGSTLNGDLAGSGGACPGAAACPAWSNSGKFGKALSFDGVDDWVDTNSKLPAIFDGSNTVTTFTFWVQSNNPTVYADSVPMGTLNSGNNQVRLIVGNDNATNNHIQLLVNSGAWANNYAAVDSTSITISANTWYHVAIILDLATLSNSKIYVNGSQVSSTTPTNGTPPIAYPVPQNNFAFGYFGSAGDFKGLLDEVKIYNFALTADEIKIDYNRGQAVQFGALSDNSTYEKNAANQEYCVPGDSTSCAAPIAEWKFEEGTGSTANDTSGTGNSITLATGASSPTWINGKIGKGLYCNGSNYGTINNRTSFPTGASARTLSLWLKFPTNSPVANQALWGYGENSNGRRFNAWFGTNQLCIETVNYARCFSWTPDTNWHQFTAVYPSGHASTSFIILYLDGVLQTGFDSGTPKTMNTQVVDDWHLCSISGTSYFYTGNIDQIRLFNYARTPAQIAWDYNRGGPVGWWKMDECTGTTIYNAAPTASGAAAGMDGTITLSGNAAGTCTSATTTDAWYLGASGKYNSALGLDGNDYATVTDTASYAFAAATQDFSAFAWVKRAATDVNHFVISKEDGANDGWNMQITSGNLVSCAVNDKVFTSTSTIDTNWHHVGCVVSRAGNGQVYIDGRADGTAVAISSTAMDIASTTTTIGVRNYTPASTYFNGLIDDLRIYNYALTAAQIKLLYNQNAAVRFGPATGSP